MDRTWLVRSLTELGRFAETAEHEADAIRLAELTQHAFLIGSASIFSAKVHVQKGDWAKARSLIERGIAVLRAENVDLPAPLRGRLLSLGSRAAR
jgi:hypothetical protein